MIFKMVIKNTTLVPPFQGFLCNKANRNYKKRSDMDRKYFERLAFDRLALVGFVILL